jgi:enamine deaminase RidA (YjgF/YER057c/UK114 family)
MSIDIAETWPAGAHAPAVRVSGPSGLYFLSGINPNPLHAGQPMTEDEERLPAGIREQTLRTLLNLVDVLTAGGLTWHNVAKILVYLTDIREAPIVREMIAERFGTDWTPALTTVQVDNLVARGARVQFDVIAAGPPAAATD